MRSCRVLRIVYWQFLTDVSGQRFGPIFKSQELHEDLDFLTREDGTGRLSRNVGKELSLYPVKYPRRAQVSFTSRRKPEIAQLSKWYLV
jgi:hypothetical protein